MGKLINHTIESYILNILQHFTSSLCKFTNLRKFAAAMNLTIA